MRMQIRVVSLELKKFPCLFWRDFLSDEDRLSYLNKEKGLEGELIFDSYLNRIPSSTSLILDDLFLEQKNTAFQLDSTLILQNKLHFFEVKNFESDFFISGDHWYTLSGKEITSPLHQLQRSATLLKQLLIPLADNTPYPLNAMLSLLTLNLFYINYQKTHL